LGLGMETAPYDAQLDRHEEPVETLLDHINFLAEREGFEPSVSLPAQRFSRASNSTTLAPLHLANIVATP
jgi:hypothetical protein